MPRVLHFEIAAGDPERAVQFYGNVFGWRFQKWEGPMEYWMISTGNDSEPGIDGGLARKNDTDSGTVNTIGVSSVDRYSDMIAGSGGTIVHPKSAIPGVGWLAYCQDPDGNTFGIMESDPAAA